MMPSPKFLRPMAARVSALVVVLGATQGVMQACDTAGTETPLVDETGFIVGEHLRYTSAQVLSVERPSPLTVVGLPGAITTPGGTLTVASGADPTPRPAAVTAEGGFAALVSARGDDNVTLHYVRDGAEDTYVLRVSDTLGAVAPPVVTGSSSSGGQLTVSLGSDGLVTVALSDVQRGEPLVVFNEDNGAVRVADLSATDVQLPGAGGDRICVFAVSASDQAASTTLCATVL